MADHQEHARLASPRDDVYLAYAAPESRGGRSRTIIQHSSNRTMDRTDRKHLPIGYWLRRADELLTARIDAVQRENGLSRLGWQILNVVRDGDEIAPDDVVSTLAPFASAAAIHDTLAVLRDRGILAEAEGQLRITEPGSDLYQHALSAQQAIREAAFAGIDRDEYETTLGVLRRLVENLERMG